MYHEPWKGREQRHQRGRIHSAGISRKQDGVGRSNDKQEDEDLFGKLYSGMKGVIVSIELKAVKREDIETVWKMKGQSASL